MILPVFPLETPRLRIEAYRESDVDRVHRIFADAETMTSWPEPFTRERSQAWVAAAMRSFAETGIGRGIVVLRATGETIGDAGIQRSLVDGETRFDLGVTLAAPHHGAGYATELARALLAAAFDTLRLPEVYAHASLDRAVSRAVLERAGFRLVRTFANERNRDVASGLYAAHAAPARVAPRVKMCGMTSPYDAELAIAAGADAIGMIFAASERRVTLETAREIVRSLPPLTERVAVFVDADGADVRRVCDELGALPQFSGRESLDYCERFGGERCLRVVRVAAGAESAELARAGAGPASILPLFETSVDGRAGGTGRRFEWPVVARAAKERPIGIAGGLTPENVAECVRLVRPYAVDVRSGVESGGKKNFERMQAFVAAARMPAPAFA